MWECKGFNRPQYLDEDGVTRGRPSLEGVDESRKRALCAPPVERRGTGG